MHTTDYILLSYSTIVVVASFLNLVRIDYWWIRMWDFPHLQLTVLAAIGLLSWLGLGYPTEGYLLLVPIGLLATLLYQGWLIHPFTPLHRKQVPHASRKAGNDQPTVRLLVANVFMENTNVPAVRSLADAYKPDVLLVLEANRKWQQELAPIEADFPHRVLYPLENTYGMLFYSRFPIRHYEIRFLIQDDIPSVYAQLEMPSGQGLHFYGVHPMPPSPTEHYRSTERDAELLLVGKEASHKSGPVIVAGDLNDVAWSHSTRLFQRISGLLDPRIGRGLYNTFHANYFFLRWPLDHVFVSHHFQLRKIRRLPNCGSDHFPMFIELTCMQDAEQPPELVQQADEEDLKEVREKITEATH